MSFAQAAKQKDMQRKAENKAAEMMAQARGKLEVNVYDQLAIAKEPYELQREALLTQGATALQAGVEGEARGAAATAGRVQMAQQQGQAQTRAAMTQELMGLEKLSAAEESRLRDIGVQLDLAEASGAQLAARDAQAASAAAVQQGMQGITSMASQLSAFAPLYEKSQAGRQLDKLAGQTDGGMTALMNEYYTDQNGVVNLPAGMNEMTFRDMITQQGVGAIDMLRQKFQ